jgi:hypothetical protein
MNGGWARLDNRRRLALAKHVDPSVEWLLVEEHPDGTITLTPGIVVPASAIKDE